MSTWGKMLSGQSSSSFLLKRHASQAAGHPEDTRPQVSGALFSLISTVLDLACRCCVVAGICMKRNILIQMFQALSTNTVALPCLAANMQPTCRPLPPSAFPLPPHCRATPSSYAGRGPGACRVRAECMPGAGRVRAKCVPNACRMRAECVPSADACRTRAKCAPNARRMRAECGRRQLTEVLPPGTTAAARARRAPGR